MKHELPTFPDLASYPNFTRGHALKPNGTCSCGRWSMTGNERVKVRSHQYHTLSTKVPHRSLNSELEAPVSTFPDSLVHARDRFLDEAQGHPHFKDWSHSRVKKFIEDRMWSVVVGAKNQGRAVAWRFA